MTLKDKVKAFVERQTLLTPGDRVLVGVSGGPDSVALLDVLYELREEWSLHLEVAHLQHGMRGEEAREDARFVAALADSLNLPLHLKEVSIPDIKKIAGKGNLEALARDERYRFFMAVAQERDLNKVATAHTLDDQAETVLLWFLRGCGTKGLAGISPLRHCLSQDADSVSVSTLVRPLLGISKAEILDYLEERRLAWRMDRTNEDPALLRNWIRLELLPRLASRIDARWPQRLACQAALFRDEDVFMDRLARIELEKLRASTGLDRKLLAEQDPALQRRILRLWLSEVRGQLRGLDFNHIEQAVNLVLRGAPNARLSIPGAWELVNAYESVRVKKRSRKPKRCRYSYKFRVGELLEIPEAGIALVSKRTSVPPSAHPRMPRNLEEGLFDAALLSEDITVRSFCAGDRYQPLGMKGHKKVKDLFIEKKVPLSVRSVLPLFSMGAEILWIPAYARSETAKIGPQTTEFLQVQAVSLER